MKRGRGFPLVLSFVLAGLPGLFLLSTFAPPALYSQVTRSPDNPSILYEALNGRLDYDVSHETTPVGHFSRSCDTVLDGPVYGVFVGLGAVYLINRGDENKITPGELFLGVGIGSAGGLLLDISICKDSGQVPSSDGRSSWRSRWASKAPVAGPDVSGP